VSFHFYDYFLTRPQNEEPDDAPDLDVVEVDDGGAANNVITRTFTVTVNSVNDAPTLDTLANTTINENASQQTVNLTGISSGAANETQTALAARSRGT